MVAGLHTFAVGEVLTAANTNGYLMNQAIAVVTSGTRPGSPVEGQHIYETDTDLVAVYNGSAWVYVSWQSASVATGEATASTSYVDLATSGPAVTVATNTKALVTLHAHASQGTATIAAGAMSFAVSGATTLAAADARAAIGSTNATVWTVPISRTFLVTGLTAGSNVFTAKYRATANTWTFGDRDISVVGIT